MNQATLTSAAHERGDTTAPGDVHATVTAIGSAARAAGMRVFARVDHGAGAREAGLELRDEVLLLVGAPEVGTALMQVAPRAGLDLPLHVLVWDDDGTTRVTWRDPRALAAEHGLGSLTTVLDAMEAGLRKVVTAAVGPAA